MLYKGIDVERARAMYDSSTGDLCAAIPRAYCGNGDFGARPLVYWTPMREVANRYSEWAKHKVKDVPLAILQIAVPDAFVEKLKALYLWFDDSKDTWRQVVYHGRNGEMVPRDLSRRVCQEPGLLIGHILSGPNEKYGKFTSHQQIKKEHCLQVKNAEGQLIPAIQWVFFDKPLEELRERCEGKGWIHQLGANYSSLGPRD